MTVTQDFDVELAGTQLFVGSIDSTANQTVLVEFDCTGQHTISWTVPLFLRSEPNVGLPPGKCNLYMFSTIVPVEGGDGRPLGAEEAEVLMQLLLLLAADAGKTGDDEKTSLFDIPDKVGAYPIHAILVGNTDESLKAVWRLMEAVPALLEQTHTTSSFGLPLFNGESSLHVAIVNGREDLLLRMLDLGERTLSHERFATLLNHQVEGVFFKDAPMNWYGGSALAFACCFGLKRAVTKMLATKHVSINEGSCDVTGFYPIHAVVANRRRDMYDFLVGEHGADPNKLLAKQSNIGALTPLQLAATLGNKVTFKHMLRQQCNMQWKWGPCSQYDIDLQGIDSGCEGGGDVMELIGKIDASKGTHELLLDSFMNGFLNQLFRQKWARYGYKLHAVRLLFDFIALCITITLAFGLKEDPKRWHDNVPFPIVILLLSMISIIHELAGSYLYYRNERGGHRVSTTRKTASQSTLRWMFGQRMDAELLGHIFLILACVIMLSGWITFDNVVEVEVSQTIVGRALRGGSDQDVTEDAVYVALYGAIKEVDGLNALWPLLALGSICRIMSITRLAYIPFESMNIFVLTVGKILVNDIIKFMALFANFVFAFFCALYFLYPTAAGFEQVGFVPTFNAWHGALVSIVQLAFLGAEFDVELGWIINSDELSNLQVFDLALFAIM